MRTATGPTLRKNAARANEAETDTRRLSTRRSGACKGMFASGANAKTAKIGGDLCEQAARAINRRGSVWLFTPISEADLFDMEYWSLEQAKLKVAGIACGRTIRPAKSGTIEVLAFPEEESTAPSSREHRSHTSSHKR